MKLRDLLNVAYDETWIKAVDNETNGDYEELFVWVADWIGGDKTTLDRVQPLLDREIEDVTLRMEGTPGNSDAHDPVIVVNLVARQSAKMKFDVTCERRFLHNVTVVAESQEEAERIALESMEGVRLQDVDEDSMWMIAR